ncbi:MAG: hypothetical protein IK092_07035, partial [Muribaculaceae bacterium]|nr:hypothetical protein [Muribaculaceae bacterium]
RPINPDSQQPMAYRTYNTDAELVDLMHFIDQAEYSRFNGVIFVSSKYVNPNIPMHRITSQLVKVYGIHSPVYKVEADRTLGLRDGSRATIIYTKPGYANKRVSFTVGAPCECVSYDGSTIVVKEPPATLQFAKNVVVVVMKDGKPCDSARVVMQVGSQAPLNMHSERTKGKYVFNDLDAPVDSTIEFKVRELNCEVAAFTVQFSEIVSDKPLRQINLESRKKTVTLLFADGQSQTITIPEGGEIDMALKRGSYMGKAVEMVSANTYKVHKRRAATDKPLPWWRKKWVMIVGAVIALAAIAAVLYLLVFKKVDAASNEGEITVLPVAMNEAVVDYMAKNDVWQRDSIKADKICEQVYICMGKGNFTKLDSLAYDKLPDSLKNEKYSIISTKFKQLQPTDSAEVINKMSKLFVDENGNMTKAIDLGKILEFFAPFITDEIPNDYKEDKPAEKSKDNDKTKTVEKDKKKTDKETTQQPPKQETITKPEPPAQDPVKLAALQSAIASYNKIYADYEKATGSAKEVMKGDVKDKGGKVVKAAVAALGNNVKWADLQSKYGCKPQVK